MDNLENYWKQYNYPSFSKFWKIIKTNKLPYNYTDVKNFVDNKKSIQLHKNINENKKYYVPFVTASSCFDWQCDLLDMSKYSRTNKGYKWILIVIDIFDRKVFAVAMKDKSTHTSTEAMKLIFDLFKCSPSRLTTDDGSEWKGQFQKLLDEKKITHRIAEQGDHKLLGVIDRFSRTLKTIIFKYFTENNTTTWFDMLDNFIKTYNNVPHSGICDMSPNDANKYWMSTRECHLEKLSHVVEYNFHIGDIVRIRLKKKIFEKGYTRQWSKKTYEIIDKIGQAYVLNNGNHIRGHDIQKVSKPDENKIQVDEIDKENKNAKFVRKQKLEHIGKVTDDGTIIPENKRMIPSKEKRIINKKKDEPYHYEVESIVDDGIENDGKKLYRIHWKGYPSDQDTWQQFKDVKNLKAYDEYIKLKKNK